MRERQHAEPFEYEETHLVDVANWIVVDGLAQHAGRAAALDGVRRRSHEARQFMKTPPTGDRTGVQAGSLCQSLKAQDFESNALPVLPGGQGAREGGRHFVSLEELALDPRYLAEVVKAMDRLPVLHPAKLGLHRLQTSVGHLETNTEDAAESFGSACERLEVSEQCEMNKGGTHCLSFSPGDDDLVNDDADSVASDTSSNIPSELTELFDITGDTSILMERILELRCTMEERTWDSSSQESDALSLQYLQASLAAAQDRASRQRALCHERGLDPELFRYRRRASSTC